MLEKFLKLTPKLSELFPIFDTLVKLCTVIQTNRDRSTFLNLQRTCFQVFAIFLPQVPKITSKIRLRLKNHFFPNSNTKNPIIIFFPVKFYDGKASFSSQNYFSQAEISYESKGALGDQVKVSEKTHGVKNTEMR